MMFEQGQKVVFIGDSITDCGRRDAEAPYGNGYVSLVRSFVTAGYPKLGLRWENRGVGGDTVRDLDARWEHDVIAEQPDWLSVKIGINDVWRAFGTNAHEAVPIAEYEETYRRLLRRAVDVTGCRLIVAEPYVIEPDRADPMRVQMDAFGRVARKLAIEFGAVNVRTQEAFDAVLSTTSPHDWADDRVHPSQPGHAVIATAYLKALGFELG
ncbi:MAG: SGNH/GDSL hydrolase family protein [Chloroflexia bacterium]|nr:SGNH/GDSL hydrolase family protein [Chloroflexia bacterium]